MKTWSYPYPVHYFRHDKWPTLAYVDEGHGDHTILFLHGLGSNLKGWQKNIDGLKKHARCLALDLPGYGKSDSGDFPFSMSYFAEAVQAIIDKMELQKVVLIGHSMGGQVAVHTVLRSIKNLEKLVLIAPAGFEIFSERESGFLQKSITPQVIKNLTEEQILKNFEVNFYQMPDDARFMIDDRMAMRKTEEYDHFCHMIPQCVRGMLDEPIHSILPQVKTPALVLFGENDGLIPNPILHPEMTVKEVAKKGCGLLPKGILTMIPEAGHFVQWEQSGSTNKAILEFIYKN